MHRFFRISLLLFCVTVLAGFSVSFAYCSDHFPEVSTVDLQKRIAVNEPFVLIDTRTLVEYEESHIVGAVNIAPAHVEASHCRLPEDKNVLVVVYCDDDECAEGEAVARQLVGAGYSSVRNYRGGLAAWESAGLPLKMGAAIEPGMQADKVSVQQMRKIIDRHRDDYTILDVREPDEFAKGHIPGAQNLPVREFHKKATALSPDKPVIVYCNTQKRSFIAYRKLVETGFRQILFASYIEWLEANGPIEITERRK